MRRSGRMLVAAALLLVLLPASTTGQSASPASAGSPPPGASLSVDVPAGAAPAGTTVTVLSHDPSERPDELKAVPMALAFYELLPSDVQFSEPVTVKRSIGFPELGIASFDPAFDGLIVGALFTRDSGGKWSWLDNTEVRLDTANGAFTVTGTTDHSGPIFAYVPGDLIVANEDTAVTPVGQTFRVEGQLRVDPASRADIAAVSGTTSDDTVAKPGQSYEVAFFDRAAGLEFQCLAPGTVDYTTTFAVSSVADVSPLNGPVGLPATDVAVTQSGEHTCG